MKVVPQIVTFIVLMLVGWYAYEQNEPFHDLMDDIFDYAGIFPAEEPVLSHDLLRHEPPAVQVQQPKPVEPDQVRGDAETMVAPTPVVQETIQQQTPTASAEPSASPEPATEPEAASVSSAEQPDDRQKADTAAVPDKQSSPPQPEGDEVSQGTKKSRWTRIDQASSVQLPPVKMRGNIRQPSVEKPAAEQPVAEVEAVEKTQQPATDDTPMQDSQQLPESVTERLSTEGTSIGTTVPPEPVDQLSVQADRQRMALEGLESARAAWYQGDHDGAIKLYWQLLREFRNHPDFAGELGNIYFSKGQTEMAVNAYSEAYLRLLRNNDLQRAQQVLEIVYNIDQEQAALLREYLPR